MIPQIDRYNWAIQFSQSKLGMVLIYAVFSFGLYLSDLHLWPLIILACIVLDLFPRNYGKAFVMVSVVLAVLPGGHTASTTLVNTRDSLLRFYPDVSLLNILLAKIAAILTVFLVFLGYRKFYPLLRKRTIRLGVLSYVGLVVFLKETEINLSIELYLWSLVLFLAIVVWNLGYLSNEREVPRLSDFKNLLPFWRFTGTTSAPVHRGRADLDFSFVKSVTGRAELRLNAIKLLYWCLFLRLLGYVVSDLVLGTNLVVSSERSLNIVNIFNVPYQVTERLDLSVWELWLSLLSNSLIFLLVNVSSLVGIMISIARFTGFKFYRNTYRPLDSNSFHDFFNRVFFYYNEILINFFFYPIWAFFRGKIVHKKFRLFSATFLTVFVGGAVVHFVRNFPAVVRLDLGALGLMFLSRFPYFFLLGLFAGLSVAFESRRKVARYKVLQYFRVFLYFCLYSICLVGQANYRYGDIQSQAKLFLRLFGVHL